MADILERFTKLWGSGPQSDASKEYLSGLDAGSKSEPEVKIYADAVYFNYSALGLSLLFNPLPPYRPKAGDVLDNSSLKLQSIDIFNAAQSSSKGAPRSRYAPFPALPIHFKASDDNKASQVSISAETTARQFVEALGEPERKGGGSGPLSGSIDIWLEWTKLGMMVEFGGEGASGPQAWERGKDARWKTFTFFPPS